MFAMQLFPKRMQDDSEGSQREASWREDRVALQSSRVYYFEILDTTPHYGWRRRLRQEI